MTNTKANTTPSKQPKARALNIIQDTVKAQALIKSIATRGKRLDVDIQDAAVTALWHAYTHGSTALTQTLIDAMPKSSRLKALKTYLMDLGCYRNTEKNTLGIDAEKRAIGLDLKACEKPFYEYTHEGDVMSPVDAMALVRNLIKRLQAAKGSGLLDDSSVLDKLMQVAPAVIPAVVPSETAVNSGVAELDI